MSSGQWDLIRQVFGSWEMSCMVEKGSGLDLEKIVLRSIMACCYRCEGTALGYEGFPHCIPSPAKSLGVCMDAVGAVPCGS